MRRRAVVALAVAAVLVLVLAACGSTSTTAGAPGPTSPTPVVAFTPNGPFGVTRTRVTLVDPSRPTEAGTRTASEPERTLVTDVYVPQGSGPFPLIVFAHGLGGNTDRVSELLTAWASAGYVVAAPSFPVTNDAVPGASDNWRNVAAQPGDISFLLDSLLGTGGDHAGLGPVDDAVRTDGGPGLTARIDGSRIGVAGHSLGGATTYGVVFNTCCRDPRIKAAEVLSGAELPVGVPPGGTFDLDGHVPLLIVHGDHDTSLDHHLDADVFAAARPPVWFVTLVGGSHSDPYENDPSPWDQAVTTITTGFWDATLGHEAGDLSGFAALATVPGLTTVQVKLP